MTPEYHLTCAGVELPFQPKRTAKPLSLAEAADRVTVNVKPPTVLGLLDAAIAKSSESEVRALLTQARALLV